MYAGPSSTSRFRNATAFSGVAPLLSPGSSLAARPRKPERSAKSPSPYRVKRPTVAVSRDKYRGARIMCGRTEQERCHPRTFSRAMSNQHDEHDYPAGNKLSGRVGVTRVAKPWGYEIIWAMTDAYVGKVLHVNAGQALSVQYHHKKDETVYLLSGEMIYW